MCGEKIYIYGVHISRKCIASRPFLLMLLFPTQKSRQTFLKICFLQQQKGLQKNMIRFVKIQLENMKMTRNIRLFIFCMICNFYEFVALQFCE